jgi:Spy/CpxP family protein refolding chaperone
MKKVLLASLTAVMLLGSGTTTLHAKQNNHKKQTKPFLITGKMPHYTMLVKKHWDDPKLALTPKQKTALLKIRKETLQAIKSLKPQVMKLEKKIVHATMQGEDPASLEKDINTLASLKAKATMAHVRCIVETKKVLTPKQLKLLKKH